MFNTYDELELLALIEGGLDPAAEKAVRDRLAADPAAARVVAGMVRDRDLLRTEREPVMPPDLSSRVEQALTRPMLIAAWGEDEHDTGAVTTTRPGVFRRRHQRALRFRSAARFAMAASIGLLLIGGLWLGVDAGLDALRTDDRVMAAETDAARTASDERHAAARDELWPPADSAIHHYAPQPVLESLLAQREEHRVPLRSDAVEPVAVEFALVIRGSDRESAEKGIEYFITERSLGSAFVLNFNYEEALRAEKDWLAARGDSRAHGAPPHHTGPAAAQHQPQSRHLAGPRDIAAAVEQQIDYASRGATHTITIRLSELHVFLEEIERTGIAKGSSLQPLPKRQSEKAEALWTASLAAVREAITKLDETGDDPLIHLPIVIE